MMTLFRPYFVNCDTLFRPFIWQFSTFFRRTFWRSKSIFGTTFKKLELYYKNYFEIIFIFSRGLYLDFRGNYEKRKKGVSSDFFMADHFLILIFI